MAKQLQSLQNTSESALSKSTNNAESDPTLKPEQRISVQLSILEVILINDNNKVYSPYFQFSISDIQAKIDQMYELIGEL